MSGPATTTAVGAVPAPPPPPPPAVAAIVRRPLPAARPADRGRPMTSPGGSDSWMGQSPCPSSRAPLCHGSRGRAAAALALVARPIVARPTPFAPALPRPALSPSLARWGSRGRVGRARSGRRNPSPTPTAAGCHRGRRTQTTRVVVLRRRASYGCRTPWHPPRPCCFFFPPSLALSPSPPPPGTPPPQRSAGDAAMWRPHSRGPSPPHTHTPPPHLAASLHPGAGLRLPR